MADDDVVDVGSDEYGETGVTTSRTSNNAFLVALVVVVALGKYSRVNSCWRWAVVTYNNSPRSIKVVPPSNVRRRRARRVRSLGLGMRNVNKMVGKSCHDDRETDGFGVGDGTETTTFWVGWNDGVCVIAASSNGTMVGDNVKVLVFPSSAMAAGGAATVGWGVG